MAAFDEDNNGQNLWFAAKWIEEPGRQDAAGPSGGAGLGAFRIGLLVAAALFLLLQMTLGYYFSVYALFFTSLPGADRLVWRHVGGVMERASSEKLGYRRELVSEPPDMYGVDILSCPYHELARELGDEKAVLCICRMDKEYSQGFRHIRYDRSSAVSEGARACEYRLRFDPGKD